MIFYAGVLAVIVALIRRGSFKHLANWEIRQMWLVFVPPVLIIFFALARKFGMEGFVLAASGWLHIVSYACLLILVWLNRKLSGAAFLAVGLILNMTVLLANGGRMPVSYQAAEKAGTNQKWLMVLREDKMTRHKLMTENTRLNFLGDIIPVYTPRSIDPEVSSVGDVALAVGVFLLVQAAMLPRKNSPSAADRET